MESSNKSEKKQYKKDAKGQYFVKGTAPGPGRPPGSLSIMGELKKLWQNDPERFKKYIERIERDRYLHREIIHQIDGKPKESIHLSGGIATGRIEEMTDEQLNTIINGGGSTD